MNHLGNAVEKKVTTGATASIGCTEVGSIGMYIEDHVRGLVANRGVGMCGHVIQKLVDTVACVFSGCVLLGSNGRERHEDCRINGMGIVEETAANLLDTFFVGLVEFGTGVVGYSVLVVFTIYDGKWAVGAMLGLYRMRMLVAE